MCEESRLKRLRQLVAVCVGVTSSLFAGERPIMSLLRKEMDKYRDVDEDELLKKLSEEELQRLEDELEELDPDVSL